MKVALDVARGMDVLHSSGLIHRDLKANNLLVKGCDDLVLFSLFSPPPFHPVPFLVVVGSTSVSITVSIV